MYWTSFASTPVAALGNGIERVALLHGVAATGYSRSGADHGDRLQAGAASSYTTGWAATGGEVYGCGAA